MINSIGYYFIVFQTTFTGYVKCWMDGNENYKYFTVDEFLNLFTKSNSPSSLRVEASKCIDTSSIYMWDVENSTIRRLNPSTDRPSLRSEINRLKPF